MDVIIDIHLDSFAFLDPTKIAWYVALVNGVEGERLNYRSQEPGVRSQGTEAQRHRGTEAQRHRGQRHRGSAVQVSTLKGRA